MIIIFSCIRVLNIPEDIWYEYGDGNIFWLLGMEEDPDPYLIHCYPYQDLCMKNYFDRGKKKVEGYKPKFETTTKKIPSKILDPNIT